MSSILLYSSSLLLNWHHGSTMPNSLRLMLHGTKDLRNSCLIILFLKYLCNKLRLLSLKNLNRRIPVCGLKDMLLIYVSTRYLVVLVIGLAYIHCAKYRLGLMTIHPIAGMIVFFLLSLLLLKMYHLRLMMMIWILSWRTSTAHALMISYSHGVITSDVFSLMTGTAVPLMTHLYVVMLGHYCWSQSFISDIKVWR